MTVKVQASMKLPNGDDFSINVIVDESEIPASVPGEGYCARILYLSKALEALAHEIETDHEGVHFCFGENQWNEALHA